MTTKRTKPQICKRHRWWWRWWWWCWWYDDDDAADDDDYDDDDDDGDDDGDGDGLSTWTGLNICRHTDTRVWVFVVCVLCVCCVCVVCVLCVLCVLCVWSVCCVCVDELKLHSNMCVHECARCAIDLPSWPTDWTAQLGSTTGQHHWPALWTPLVSTTDQHHWLAALMCSCVDVVICKCVDVLMCWCVDVLMCWWWSMLRSVLVLVCVCLCVWVMICWKMMAWYNRKSRKHWNAVKHSKTPFWNKNVIFSKKWASKKVVLLLSF